jgi:uncharacterized protein
VVDVQRAQKFYSAVLEWDCKPSAMMKSPVGGIKELYFFNRGTLNGAFLVMEEGYHVLNHDSEKSLAMPVLPTFCVEDIEATLEKANKEGAKTQV